MVLLTNAMGEGGMGGRHIVVGNSIRRLQWILLFAQEGEAVSSSGNRLTTGVEECRKGRGAGGKYCCTVQEGPAERTRESISPVNRRCAIERA